MKGDGKVEDGPDGVLSSNGGKAREPISESEHYCEMARDSSYQLAQTQAPDERGQYQRFI